MGYKFILKRLNINFKKMSGIPFLFQSPFFAWEWHKDAINLINFWTMKENEWKVERWKIGKKREGLRDGSGLRDESGLLKNKNRRGGGDLGFLEAKGVVLLFYI